MIHSKVNKDSDANAWYTRNFDLRPCNPITLSSCDLKKLIGVCKVPDQHFECIKRFHQLVCWFSSVSCVFITFCASPWWPEGASFSTTPCTLSLCDLKKPIRISRGADQNFERINVFITCVIDFRMYYAFSSFSCWFSSVSCVFITFCGAHQKVMKTHDTIENQQRK